MKIRTNYRRAIMPNKAKVLVITLNLLFLIYSAVNAEGNRPIPGISGYVFGADEVTVTLSGDTLLVETTNETGYYEFCILNSGGNYVVTPSKTGCGFTPDNREYTNLTDALTDQNFTANCAFTISGNITGALDVTVDLTGDATDQTTTDEDGDYSFSGLANGNDYMITPSKAGYNFDPEYLEYLNLSNNYTDQDFTASLSDNSSGTCLEFDGVDDNVSIPSDPSLDNSQFTAEFWLKADNPGNWRGLIDKGRDTDTDWYFLTGNPGQTEGIIFGIGNGSGRLEINYSWNDSDWHHVAGTYDGTTMTLIVDGKIEASSIFAHSSTTNDIYFGSRRDQSWYFDGILDEVVFWDYARTEQEIRENMYLSYTAAETGLVSYWKLNDGSGITAVDVINGNDGTLHNMSEDDWISSTLPLGSGVSNTQIVITTGFVEFSDTGLSMNFTEKTDTDTIVTTRIDTIPNLIPTEPYDLFDQQYWIVDQYSSGTFETDLTFTFNEDLTAADESNPSRIKLYTRTSNSDGEWFFLGKAESVNVATDQATFTGITEFSQFMAGRSNITHVSGHITEDTNWQETIKVDGDIYIDDGYTLTIDPGITVEFQGHYFIDVQGRLLAQGTETDSITFTVADTTGYYDKTHTGWNGLIFDHTPAANDTSRISYCLLEYGKRTKGGAVYCDNVRKLIFSHNSFRYNYASGTAHENGGGAMYLDNSYIQVRNNIFTHNEALESGGAVYFWHDVETQPDTLYIID